MITASGRSLMARSNQVMFTGIQGRRLFQCSGITQSTQCSGLCASRL